jgi:hypothetical protein
VNRKLRSLFAPRHDAFARRIVHHVVPVSRKERGSDSGGVMSRC